MQEEIIKEIEDFYKGRFYYKGDDFVNNMINWSIHYPHIYEKNKFIADEQDKLTKMGLKQGTLRWTIESCKLLNKINTRYKGIVTWQKLSEIYQVSGLKIAIYEFLARAYFKLLSWNDKMNEALTEINFHNRIF